MLNDFSQRSFPVKRKHLTQNKEIIHKNSELVKTNAQLQKQISELRKEALTLKHSNLTLKELNLAQESKYIILEERTLRAESRSNALEERLGHHHTEHEDVQTMRTMLANMYSALHSIQPLLHSSPHNDSVQSNPLDLSNSPRTIASSTDSSHSAPSPNPLDNVSLSRRRSSAVAKASRPSIAARPELSFISEGSVERDDPTPVKETDTDNHISELAEPYSPTVIREEPIVASTSRLSPPTQQFPNSPSPSPPSPAVPEADDPVYSPAPSRTTQKIPVTPSLSNQPTLSRPVRTTKLPPKALSAAVSLQLATDAKEKDRPSSRPARRASGIVKAVNTPSPDTSAPLVTPATRLSRPSRTSETIRDEPVLTTPTFESILPPALTAKSFSRSSLAVVPEPESIPESPLLPSSSLATPLPAPADGSTKTRARASLVASMGKARTSLAGGMMPKAKAGGSATSNESGAKARKVLKEVQPRELWIKKSDKIFDSSSDEDEISPRAEEAVSEVPIVEQEVVVDDDEIEVVRAKPSRSRSRSVSVPVENESAATESDRGVGVGRGKRATEQNDEPPKKRERKVVDYSEPAVASPPRPSKSTVASTPNSAALKHVDPVPDAPPMEILVEEETVEAAAPQEEENGGRRSRKSVVNYAQPKLNTKMRRPGDYVATIAKPLPRKSLHNRTSSSTSSHNAMTSSLPPPVPAYRHPQNSAEIDDPSPLVEEEELQVDDPLPEVPDTQPDESSAVDSQEEEEEEDEEEVAVKSEYQKRNDRILAMLGPPERVVEAPTKRRESRRTSQAGY